MIMISQRIRQQRLLQNQLLLPLLLFLVCSVILSLSSSCCCCWAFSSSTTTTTLSSVSSFSFSKTRRIATKSTTTRSQQRRARNAALFNSLYGRGAEIWPPSSDEPIQLANSFPNGKIPDVVLAVLQQQQFGDEELQDDYYYEEEDDDELMEDEQQISTGEPFVTSLRSGSDDKKKGGGRRRKRRMPRTLKRILKRAANAENEDVLFGGTSSSSTDNIPAIEKTPAIVALIIVAFGYIQPLDLLLTTFFSGYFVILSLWCQSLRDTQPPVLQEDEGSESTSSSQKAVADVKKILKASSSTSSSSSSTPTVPALPPQGHVPILVSNPLGRQFTYSRAYDRWLKLGVVLGLLAPIGASLWYHLQGRHHACAVTIRPVFFLCCQALSESLSRRAGSATPLPLRILIPVVYNTIRLGYLWQWTVSHLDVPLLTSSFGTGFTTKIVSTGALGVWGRWLAVGNLVYWSLNLFAFLLPIGVMRYMRAHFFCVEAESVTTRRGMEGTLGLL